MPDGRQETSDNFALNSKVLHEEESAESVTAAGHGRLAHLESTCGTLLPTHGGDRVRSHRSIAFSHEAALTSPQLWRSVETDHCRESDPVACGGPTRDGCGSGLLVSPGTPQARTAGLSRCSNRERACMHQPCHEGATRRKRPTGPNGKNTCAGDRRKILDWI